jgi:DNA-directed RNA polymerase specialized sigma24 family protein
MTKADNTIPKSKRKPRKVYYEPTYLREMLGLESDISLSLEGSPKHAQPHNPSDAFADLRTAMQPDQEDEIQPKKVNNSRRYKRFWASLTKNQKEALRLVYTHNRERLSKAAVANKLGIRIETLQERINYAIKKLLKHFPEYSESKIAKKFAQMLKSIRPK